MKEFTIRDIENLSGIKAHTWRIWEQRYDIDVSQRKGSNHRFYDNENLKQILRIAFLYHSGVKISKISHLAPDQIKEMALSTLPVENNNGFYIKELLEAAIDLDEERFERTLHDAWKRLGIENTVLKIISAFQQKIGVLWLTDHIIPAQEHFTSNIIRQKLAVAIDSLPYVKNTEKKEILLFTPENEYHEIPLQFIHYLLRKNKHKVIYFGRNISWESLEVYQQNCSIRYMLFHLVTNLNILHPNEYLQELSNRFPRVTIIMTGSLTKSVVTMPKNVCLLRSIDEIIRFAQE